MFCGIKTQFIYIINKVHKYIFIFYGLFMDEPKNLFGKKRKNRVFVKNFVQRKCFFYFYNIELKKFVSSRKVSIFIFSKIILLKHLSQPRVILGNQLNWCLDPSRLLTSHTEHNKNDFREERKKSQKTFRLRRPYFFKDFFSLPSHSSQICRLNPRKFAA